MVQQTQLRLLLAAGTILVICATSEAKSIISIGEKLNRIKRSEDASAGGSSNIGDNQNDADETVKDESTPLQDEDFSYSAKEYESTPAYTSENPHLANTEEAESDRNTGTTQSPLTEDGNVDEESDKGEESTIENEKSDTTDTKEENQEVQSVTSTQNDVEVIDDAFQNNEETEKVDNEEEIVTTQSSDGQSKLGDSQVGEPVTPAQSPDDNNSNQENKEPTQGDKTGTTTQIPVESNNGQETIDDNEEEKTISQPPGEDNTAISTTEAPRKESVNSTAQTSQEITPEDEDDNADEGNVGEEGESDKSVGSNESSEESGSDEDSSSDESKEGGKKKGNQKGEKNRGRKPEKGHKKREGSNSKKHRRKRNGKNGHSKGRND